MQNNEEKIKSKTKTTKLDLKVIYENCEEFGISKEIVALFPSFERKVQRRILDEQNNKRP